MKSRMIGTDPNQVPTNSMLGGAAYMDSDAIGMVQYDKYHTSDWMQDGAGVLRPMRGSFKNSVTANSGGDSFFIPIDPGYKQSIVYCSRMLKATSTLCTEYLALAYESGSQISSALEYANMFQRANGTSGFQANGTNGTWPQIGSGIDDGFIMQTTVVVSQSDASLYPRPCLEFTNTYTYSGVGITQVHGSIGVNNATGSIGALQFNVDPGGVNYQMVDYKVFGVY